MESEFRSVKYLNKELRKDLSKHLDLEEKVIKVWYQNRRRELKDKKNRSRCGPKSKSQDVSTCDHGVNDIPLNWEQPATFPEPFQPEPSEVIYADMSDEFKDVNIGEQNFIHASFNHAEPENSNSQYNMIPELPQPSQQISASQYSQRFIQEQLDEFDFICIQHQIFNNQFL